MQGRSARRTGITVLHKTSLVLSPTRRDNRLAKTASQTQEVKEQWEANERPKLFPLPSLSCDHKVYISIFLPAGNRQ
ncbi:hypothetical protein E2C01_046234 [Portunus trituberculatus]|uniref:Uncharacterized protein n=1 Tax=Portunus trituberculatus TaxID=210409 RepID=A0A5B7G4I3_PORTR|nr:hypothetical protein [Portunus trituberculatus]